MVALVTGGAGFIGSHLVDLLLSKNHKVIVLDNLATGNLDNLPKNSNLEFIKGDILDTELVHKLVPKADYIFHLAAVVSVNISVEKPEFSKAVNIDGSFNVISAARHHKNLKNLFFASSAAVYGNPEALPLIENTPHKNPISPYGLEKFLIEQYLEVFGKLYDLPWVAGRFFNVYGNRQDPKSPYSGVISKFLDMKKSNQDLTIFGTGEQTRDFIHVSDIVSSIYALTIEQTSPLCCAANIGTGQATSVLQIADMIQQIHDIPVEIKHFDAKKGDPLHSLSDISLLKSKYDTYNPKRINVELLKEI